MFRMLIHPSSGACDIFVELFHGLHCSVRIEVDALVYLFSGVNKENVIKNIPHTKKTQ